MKPKELKRIKHDFQLVSIFLNEDEDQSSSIFRTIDTSLLDRKLHTSDHQKVKRLKNHELWLFETFKTRSDGKYEIERNVPSKCLTWTLAAISLNQKNELDFSNVIKVEASKKFFIDVKLSTSLRYNEVSRVDILIMNNLEKSIEVDLTVFKSQLIDNLKFMKFRTGCKFTVDSKAEMSENVHVKAKAVESATFYFKPLVTQKSQMNFLRVTAESSFERLFDEAKKMLEVDTEIKNREYTTRVAIDLRNSSEFDDNVEIYIPEFALKKSVNIEVMLSSNLVDKDLMDPQKILKISTQNSQDDLIHKMIQSTLTLVYLSKSNQIDINESKYVHFINQSLHLILDRQNQLDGSFSFQAYAKYKIVWTTAYLLEFIGFVKDVKFIEVDENVITKAIDFLKRHQADNGSFVDYDYEDNLKCKLNAQVIATFSRFPEHFEMNQNILLKCVDFLMNQIIDIETNLDNARVIYAAATLKQYKLIQDFKSLSIRQNDFLFWEVVRKQKSEKPIKDVPEKVEIACYSLIAFLSDDKLDEDKDVVFPVMTWLSNTFRQHAQVFMIKDSFVVMKMLLMHQERFLSSENNIKVQVHNEIKQKWTMEIDESNQLSQQSKLINSKSRQLAINAVGKGFAMLEIFYSYAQPVEDFVDKFEILVEVSNTLIESDSVMELRICIQRNHDIEENLISEEPTTVEIEFPDKSVHIYFSLRSALFSHIFPFFRYIYDTTSFFMLQEFKIMV